MGDGMKLTRAGYQRLISENLAWLDALPPSLERDHVRRIVERSVDHEYRGPTSMAPSAEALRFLRDAVRRFLDVACNDNAMCRDNGLDAAEAAEDEWQAIEDAVAVADAVLAARPPAPDDAPLIDRLRGLDTETRVRFYEHDFYPLSNFSAFSLRWKGRLFPTSEHAYHWEKFPGGPILDRILTASSAHEAFKIAERYRDSRRPDWDSVKVNVMREILRAKLDQHEYVRRKLLATGDRELVEDSWRDDFWGWGPNRDGQNQLGKLWMELRAELRGEDGAR